jgi:electron transfer flavoprotein beta subunit
MIYRRRISNSTALQKLIYVILILKPIPMEILVCVKQVPDTTEVKVDPKTGTLIRDGVPSILNPFDQFALEESVRLKNQYGGNVTVLSMGPPQARTALMKCLALGADRAILLSDRTFAGADTWATAYTLGLAIQKAGKFDLIMCGQQAIDGDTAQVGPEIAHNLGMAQVTYVEKVESIEAGKITVKSIFEDGYHIIEVKTPVLLTCNTPSSFQYSNPPMMAIMKAGKKPFDTWTYNEIGGDKAKMGLCGSPTQVVRVYSPPTRGKGILLNEPVDGAVKKLIEAMREKKVV